MRLLKQNRWLAQTLATQAKVFMGKRKYNDAIQGFQSAIAFDSRIGQIHYDMGLCFLKIGDFIAGALSIIKAAYLDNTLCREVFRITYRRGCHPIDYQPLIDHLKSG
jgi:hypothetical protein